MVMALVMENFDLWSESWSRTEINEVLRVSLTREADICVCLVANALFIFNQDEIYGFTCNFLWTKEYLNTHTKIKGLCFRKLKNAII